jgi:hypothetical protein
VQRVRAFQNAGVPPGVLNLASGRMVLVDLLPSSCITRLTEFAAALATRMPVKPVSETMSIWRWPDIAWPAAGPSPFTRLKTPLVYAGL